MTDKYYTFPDEATAKSLLYRIEGAVEANEELGIEAQAGYEVGNFQNIDTIGLIYKPTGETQESELGPVPVMAPVAGWHVNIRLVDGEDASALESYAVNPVTPARVWA
jgi:hypothetical protein